MTRQEAEYIEMRFNRLDKMLQHTFIAIVSMQTKEQNALMLQNIKRMEDIPKIDLEKFKSMFIKKP